MGLTKPWLKFMRFDGFSRTVSMEDIMDELQISSGNASMNFVDDVGIVYKEYKVNDGIFYS
jgi:hypothetical protein